MNPPRHSITFQIGAHPIDYLIPRIALALQLDRAGKPGWSVLLKSTQLLPENPSTGAQLTWCRKQSVDTRCDIIYSAFSS